MDCTYCISFNACSSKHGTTKYYNADSTCKHVEKVCKYFKHKLHYFELPCNIGDNAYYINYCTKSYEPVEVQVIGFCINAFEIWGVVCKTNACQFTLPIDKVYFNKLLAEEASDKLNKITLNK